MFSQIPLGGAVLICGNKSLLNNASKSLVNHANKSVLNHGNKCECSYLHTHKRRVCNVCNEKGNFTAKTTAAG